jgi:bla regulator protein blaR1
MASRGWRTQQFEAASIREDPERKYKSPPYSTDADDDGVIPAGLFIADSALTSYISFAYKLPQQHPMLEHLPQWAKERHFVIEARPEGTPTKGELRLMMQSLLADRFHLRLHFESREEPVLIMTLRTPGRPGPGLRLHKDGPPCTVATEHKPGTPVTFDMFPCGQYLAIDRRDHTVLAGARNTTIELMSAFFNNVGQLRPIVDRTGIAGTVDFSMVYAPEPRGSAAVEANADTPSAGVPFLDAIKDQLGLRLESGKASLRIPVVDDVQPPSPN